MPRRLPQLLLTGLAVLALAGCSGGSSVSQSVDDSLGIQGGNGRVIDLSSHDFQVGNVRGESLDGHPVDLASYRGKVVVVNFWGSWCVPCREEVDAFSQVARDYATKGVQFLGINIRDSRAKAIAFDEQHHVPYPSIFDSGQTLALQFPHAIPASTPTTIIVGRNGDILAKVTGGLDYTDLRTLVEDTLNGKLG